MFAPVEVNGKQLSVEVTINRTFRKWRRLLRGNKLCIFKFLSLTNFAISAHFGLPKMLSLNSLHLLFTNSLRDYDSSGCESVIAPPGPHPSTHHQNNIKDKNKTNKQKTGLYKDFCNLFKF